jgi:serine/threonine protein kinase
MLTPIQPNILVDEHGRARITDFGLATVAQSDDWIRIDPDVNHGHSARWTAPEILEMEGSYSKEADIFSFAMVMIEVRHRCVTPIRSGLADTPDRSRHSLVSFHFTATCLLQLCWR